MGADVHGLPESAAYYLPMLQAVKAGAEKTVGTPYGSGWDALYNNVATRGAVGGAAWLAKGAGWLLEQAGSATHIKPLEQFGAQRIADETALMQFVAPPSNASGLARGSQNLLSMAPLIAMQWALSRMHAKPASAAISAAEDDMLTTLRSALASPESKDAATMATLMAGSDAATQQAEGKKVSPLDVLGMALANYAMFRMPAGGTGKLPTRVTKGAASGAGGMAFVNAASGRPLSTGMLTNAAVAGTFGVMAPHEPLDARQRGAISAKAMRRDDRVHVIKVRNAADDFVERVNDHAARGGLLTPGKLTELREAAAAHADVNPDDIAAVTHVHTGRGTPSYAANWLAARKELAIRANQPSDALNGPHPSRALRTLANKYGISRADLESNTPPPITDTGAAPKAAPQDVTMHPVQAGSQEARDLGLEPTPSTPAEAGAQAADALMAQADAEKDAAIQAANAPMGGEPPVAPVPGEAPEPPIAGLDAHQPTAPALPALEPGVTRDDLVQAARLATTDGQKAAAAARLAAFDAQASQSEPAPTTPPDTVPPYDWRTDLDNATHLPGAVRMALRRRYPRAEAVLPKAAAAIRGLAAKFGGKAIVAPLKGVDRAGAKLATDYALPDGRYDIDQLKDLVRGTIEVADPHADAAAIKADLEARYGQPIKWQGADSLDPSKAPPLPNG